MRATSTTARQPLHGSPAGDVQSRAWPTPAPSVAERVGLDRRRSRSGRRLPARTSFKPACACSWRSTRTCCSRSPRHGFDRALVARLDVDEVGQRAHLADLAVGVDQHHARARRRSRRDARRSLRASAGARSSPASSCSRVRTSRARHSCSMRALASSDSRAARATRVDVEAVLRAPQRFGGRDRAARGARSSSAPQLARLRPRGAPSASTARSRCAAADRCAAVSAVIVLSTA